MASAKRLTALKVKEISLVDSPAIVEEFIVTKRADPTVPAPTKTASAQTDIRKDATQCCPSCGACCAAGMEKCPTCDADMAAAPAEGSGAEMPLTEALIAEKIGAVKAGLAKLVQDLASGACDTDECRERMWTIQDLCWDICRDSCALQVAKSADGASKIGKALETIQKAREAMRIEKAKDGDPAAEKMPGMKKFTKARVEKLAGGLAAIHEVLQEVAPSDLEKALSSLAGGSDEPGAGDTNTVPAPTTAAPVAKFVDPTTAAELQKAQNEAAVAKSAADAAKAEAEGAKAEVAELKKRFEALEKAGRSNALPEGGDPVEKSKKSVWAGLDLAP